MKLIVGLGNPGPRYRGTRHNVGFDVIDLLADRHRLLMESGPADAVVAKVRDPIAPALLAKPLTFMNLSGQAVGDLVRYFKIDPADLLVIVDEVNLPLGRLRARANGSAGGHNGLKSLVEHLGTDQFGRLRIGVGRGDRRWDLADYVLAKFEPDERPEADQAVARAVEAAEMFRVEGIGPVMNAFNREERPEMEADDGSPPKAEP